MIAGKVKTLEKIGLTSSHRTFAVVTHLKIFLKARKEVRRHLQTSAALQRCHGI